MVSHGGYGSVTEAVVAGKPVVAVPFYGDQFLNAVHLEDAGIGRQLDKYSFQPTALVSSLSSLLADERVPKALARLQTIAQISSETSPLVVSNAVRVAATVGVEHLVPRGVYLNVLHRFPPWLLALGAFVLWVLARGLAFLVRLCCSSDRRAAVQREEDNKQKRA
ncbi:hypothetical protein PINS_up003315 [Pythium insidiosum]|nr:hypothetical protein PINS_up003315 [Pythium insidiosum]